MESSHQNITILSYYQVFENNKIDLIKKIGNKCAVTDFAILLGAYVYDKSHVNDDSSLKGRTSWLYLKDRNYKDNSNCYIVNQEGEAGYSSKEKRSGCIRPVIQTPIITSENLSIVKRSTVIEVEYGEYPQYVVNKDLEEILNKNYFSGILKETGKTYTTDSRKWNDYSKEFLPKKYKEYEFNNKKYIRVKSLTDREYKLSNGEIAKENNYFWIEVSPIKWYLDKNERIIVSKSLLVSGIRCSSNNNIFEDSEMYMFLNTYFIKEIIPSVKKENKLEKETTSQQEINRNKKIRNPYNLDFELISEEELIKDLIKCDFPVCIHGKSDDGKLSRVKQLDPDCTIIYPINATIESINGKTVYDENKGEMIDIPPNWYKEIKEKSENNINNLHIILFDGIINANNQIQYIIEKLLKEKKVNGKWKLPANTRIIAIEDTIKENENKLTEQLFNKFAHVYIETTEKSWLEWASTPEKYTYINFKEKETSKRKIHPAISAYIAYKYNTNNKVLRTDYNGITPNANPKKWEMATKVLYETKKPEILKALIGEELTNDFIDFCNQKIILLDDIIEDNYTEKDIEELNTAGKYSTTMLLTEVDEDNLEKVRNFVIKLGEEYKKIFDSFWSYGDESRIERLDEANQTEEQQQYIKR